MDVLWLYDYVQVYFDFVEMVDEWKFCSCIVVLGYDLLVMFEVVEGCDVVDIGVVCVVQVLC